MHQAPRIPSIHLRGACAKERVPVANWKSGSQLLKETINDEILLSSVRLESDTDHDAMTDVTTDPNFRGFMDSWSRWGSSSTRYYIQPIITMNNLRCRIHIRTHLSQNAMLRPRTLPHFVARPPSRSLSTTPLCSQDKLSLPVRSSSAIAPLGVTAALEDYQSESKDNTNRPAPRPKIFAEFALTDRVAIISGANQGLGLEMAMALCEAGCRAVYCVDLAEEPSDEWRAAQQFLGRMDEGLEKRRQDLPSESSDEPGMHVGRLEYISANVIDQELMWDIGKQIGDKEGRLDIGVAAAGVPSSHINCLKYPAEQLRRVLDVNTSGALFTAQAAGRQMERFGIPGSIILIASMSGTITNRDHAWVSYNASKAAVIQMARNMACELGKKGIRVNSLSPGHVYTNMSAAELGTKPQLLDKWSNLNPLGRIGTTDEFRGVVTWLASDASSFCTASDIIVSGGHQSW